MKTESSIRSYYDQLYQKEIRVNPAYEIYDRLRINSIRDLAKNAHGPVLIVGCGSRLDYEIFDPSLKIFAFDISWAAVNQGAGKRSALTPSGLLLTADALKIPFPDHSFSLVICSEVLEHIPDIRSAVSEFKRVINPDGILVVSSPNWLSFFGLTRWLGEALTTRSFHSDDQPYDDWKTYKKYRDELSPDFTVNKSRGVWYLPPLHYHGKGLPRWLTRSLYFVFSPFEYFLSRNLSHWGHLIILQCSPGRP